MPLFLFKIKKVQIIIWILLISSWSLQAEDGYRLWLRYDLISDQEKLVTYRQAISGWLVDGTSSTLQVATSELEKGIEGLLGETPKTSEDIRENGTIILGTQASNNIVQSFKLQRELARLTDEGYLLKTAEINGIKSFLIIGKTDIGVLYGVFHFLRLLQTHEAINALNISNSPKIQHRLLNHWDNLDRSVERGYAGFSIWDWHKLPDFIDPRYIDYARANASLGINGTVLTNVNANALILTPAYLEKVAALADVFRPYGIKVYLTARFSAPIRLAGLETADPLNPEVQQWWKDKAKEIYEVIPDFGGFLVKANSEGQPGPQDYDRSHAEGANMLADAVKPHGGIVMWRAFVYDDKVPDDRAKQAYNEFMPLDGTFRSNVLIQVKNGAIDFQPREPFHPMFGALNQTPLMMEFQITQEYLGFATHLVYLASLFKECLEADTYAKGEGSTVAKVIDGSLHHQPLTGMAGVSNIGTDRNWTGHHFGQANWYAFGRLAWNPHLSEESIADEWIRMTFSNDDKVVEKISEIMLASRDITVNYMTPLGLHHIMDRGHHYGPGPWIEGGRPDWTSLYYHKADNEGIGFDRTIQGSNALAQYFPPVEKFYSQLETCPKEYLLWFHHLSWDYTMKSGRTLWAELCYSYYQGADSAAWMLKKWEELEGQLEPERFQHVKAFLQIQVKEAKWWRDACLLYFQTFSNKPIPSGLEKPKHDLAYYRKLSFPYAPGIQPRWR